MDGVSVTSSMSGGGKLSNKLNPDKIGEIYNVVACKIFLSLAL